MHLSIRRIFNVPFYSKEEIAQIISVLMKIGGYKPLSPKEIINRRERYYIIVIMDGIKVTGFAGYFSIDMVSKPCAEILSYVILEEFRDCEEEILKIATMHGLSQCLCCTYKGMMNDRTKKILEKIGYTRNNSYYTIYRNDFDDEIIKTIARMLNKKYDEVYRELVLRGIYRDGGCGDDEEN